MHPQEKNLKKTKVIIAPLPSDKEIIPSIYSIEVREDTIVRWLWTVLPDGNRVVTGYQLMSDS